MHNLRFGSHVDYSSSAHPSLYFHICSFTLICIPAQQRTCRPDAHYNNWSTVDNVLSYSTSYSWIIMKGCYKMGREREMVGSCQRLKICNIWKKKGILCYKYRNPIGEANQANLGEIFTMKMLMVFLVVVGLAMHPCSAKGTASSFFSGVYTIESILIPPTLPLIFFPIMQ